MLDLSGRVALVTGASRGIGRAVALRLARCGAKVAISDRRTAAEAEEVAREIRSHGGECLVVQADVSLAADVERMVKETDQAFGRIDILVNNAGVSRDTLILRMSEEDWDEVMATNLRGAFLCTRAVLRTMMRQRWGRIINISSVSGLAGNAGQANYSASKGGVIALTKTCAREFASRGVLVNAIAPGFIRTRMTDAIPEEARQKLVEAILLGRMGEPEDIARAALFLAGVDSSYITGQVLGVNGGMYM